MADPKKPLEGDWSCFYCGDHFDYWEGPPWPWDKDVVPVCGDCTDER